MRIAYLDCFAGIAGDMFLGALIGAGVPAEVLQDAAESLGLNASLRLETVDRSGISSVKVHVLEAGKLAEDAHSPTHAHVDDHTHHLHHGDEEHSHSHDHSEEHGGHSHSHEHAHGSHKHERAHVHGRSLSEIRRLIEAAKLPDQVKQMATETFDLLGHAEAKIHNVSVEKIHFHEVGAVDAIVDIAASCAGIHHLRVDRWYSSKINVGGGMVQCAHGLFPVPAPAAADLLRGMPTYSAHVEKELVTPTGAALLRMLNPTFGPQPAMSVHAIGYGAGSRNPKSFANVLRLNVGVEAGAAENSSEIVTVIETALDDSSPQVLAYVAEKALAAGALDVMLTPVVMKKGRPGTLLTVLCEPKRSADFEQLLLRETSTLGVRIRQDRRVCLKRRHVSVETPYGAIRIKVGAQGEDELNATPEFEDCRAAAAQHKVPLKNVQHAAIAVYRAGVR